MVVLKNGNILITTESLTLVAIIRDQNGSILKGNFLINENTHSYYCDTKLLGLPNGNIFIVWENYNN